MISFNIEIEKFKITERRKKKKWLNNLIFQENYKLLELNYIFLNDESLLKINKEYLNHDTYTDIITFDNSEKNKIIEGDIFISVDRIKENALLFHVSFETEMIRVMAHGLLHLCGYLDKKKKDIRNMREKENYYLEQYGKF
jgi:probable rRNA maturation factor